MSKAISAVVIEQMADLVRGLAKQCGACPRQRSALCDTCWGNSAKIIAQKLEPKRLSTDLSLVKEAITRLMKPGEWNSIARLSKESGFQHKLIADAAYEMECDKLVKRRGLWIKGK